MLAEAASLFFALLLANNIVLSQMLGVSPFLGYRQAWPSAIALSTVTAFVLVNSSVLSFFLYHWLLLPLDVSYLQLLFNLLIIAALVQAIEIYLLNKQPDKQRSMGPYLPLIIANCAVLGISLQTIDLEYGFVFTLVASLGAAAGFALVVILFTGLQQRLSWRDIPQAFQGSAIQMINLSLMALAFMGFVGIVQIN